MNNYKANAQMAQQLTELTFSLDVSNAYVTLRVGPSPNMLLAWFSNDFSANRRAGTIQRQPIVGTMASRLGFQLNNEQKLREVNERS